MYGRAVAFSFVLAMASVASAGVGDMEVVLTPPAGTFSSGQEIIVDVSLRRVAVGDPIPIRLIQFDVSVSDPSLVLTLPPTHLLTGDPTDDILFWDFGSLPGCAVDPLVCGGSHFREQDLAGVRPNVISIAYLGFTENAVLQLIVPGDTTALKVGEIEVTLPPAGTIGPFKLDLMNATEGDADVGGAEVHFNFDAPLEPFRAFSGELVGGSILLETDDCSQAGIMDQSVLATSFYPCDASLSRGLNNLLRFTFDIPILAPGPGEIEVRELLDGGQFGLDISDQLVFSVEPGNVLRIDEPGEVFANETWYAVLNDGGWCSARDFQVDYAVVKGDASGDHITAFGDLSLINVSFLDLASTPDDSRFDINSVGGVSFGDLSAANVFIGPSLLGDKPTGHGCSP